MSKKDNIIQAIKFVGFSISAGVIQILSFTLLNELIKWSYWPSYLISLILSVLWNFTLNRQYTFKSANNVALAMLEVGLYYVLFNLEYYGVHPEEIFMVWKGGLAIHGGLIGGLLTMLFYCNKYKTRLIRYLDVICVPLILGQAIGRWGNFFNQEAHGAATTYEHLKSLHIPKFIIDNMKIDGVYYTPTFLYESIACLTLFIIFIIIRRYKFRKVGTMSALYLIGYGIIRFFIEISRTDALLILGFKIAQIVSIIMIIIGIIILAKNKKKGRFEDLYNDSNNVDNLKF